MSRSFLTGILLALSWAAATTTRAEQLTRTTPSEGDPMIVSTSSVRPGQVVVEAGLAASVPVQNWNPAYTLGFDNCLRVSCRLDQHWMAGLGFDYYYFSGTNIYGNVSDNDLRILPRLVYYFNPTDKFRYYGILEAGAAFQFATASFEAFTNLNFDGALGLGIEQGLGSQDALYLEARYNNILAGDILGQDIALALGYRTGL
jgi:hypothetical protein